jgi:hypothetical protein
MLMNRNSLLSSACTEYRLLNEAGVLLLYFGRVERGTPNRGQLFFISERAWAGFQAESKASFFSAV